MLAIRVVSILAI